MTEFYAHPTSEISEKAVINSGAKIWNGVQVREEASIGFGTIIGKNSYIDMGVNIGNNVKIQNNVSVFHGVTINDGVFIGPHVCFTNDRVPRAITPDGHLKAADDWTVSATVVDYGASIGANSTILPGVHIGTFAMIGAGSVVTHDVPPHGLVFGNPARMHGMVCKCGSRLVPEINVHRCPVCGFLLNPMEEK